MSDYTYRFYGWANAIQASRNARVLGRARITGIVDEFGRRRWLLTFAGPGK